MEGQEVAVLGLVSERRVLTFSIIGRSVGVLCALAFASGCTSKKSPEDEIKAVVRAAVAAANDKKAGGVVEHAAPEFRGPQGADLRESRRILTGYFLQQGWLHIFEQELAVQIDSEGAHAQLTVVMARGNPVTSLEDVVPTQGSKMRFELDLVKRDGAWKFMSASYEQLPL